jgi:hypothetical protein
MKYISNYSEGILGQADPAQVWQSVIDSIPESLITDRSTKILNFACGHGTEADIIAQKMLSLGVDADTVKERIYVNDKGIEFTNRMRRKGYINVDTSDFLQRRETMNFGITLANPPFNSSVGDNRQEARNTNNSNLYFDFIKKALKVTTDVVVMITPAAWMQNDEMKQLILDAGLESIDWVDPSHFPGVGIRSGISLFKATKGYTGDITIRKGLAVYTVPRTSELSFDDPTKFLIVEKIKTNSMLDSKLAKGPYEIAKGTKGSLDRLLHSDSNFSDQQTARHPVKVMIYTGGSREPARYLYHRLDQTQNRYGVALPTASDKHILGAARLLNPGEGASDRLKVIYFDKKKQAENCIRYLESKLIRFVIATTKHNDTVNTNKNSFGNIPLIDFTQSWTDPAIYSHFGLTAQEQQYVEQQSK